MILLVLALSAVCPLYAAEKDCKTTAVTAVLEQELKLGSWERMQQWQNTRQYMLVHTNLPVAVVDIIGYYVFSQQPKWLAHKPSSSDKTQQAYGDFAMYTIRQGMPICRKFKLCSSGRQWDRRLIPVSNSSLVECIVKQCGKPQQQLLCDLNKRASITLAALGVDEYALKMFEYYVSVPWQVVPKNDTYSTREPFSRVLLDAGCTLQELGHSVQNLYVKANSIRHTLLSYAKLNANDQALLTRFITVYKKGGAQFVEACDEDSEKSGLLLAAISNTGDPKWPEADLMYETVR